MACQQQGLRLSQRKIWTSWGRLEVQVCCQAWLNGLLLQTPCLSVKQLLGQKMGSSRTQQSYIHPWASSSKHYSHIIIRYLGCHRTFIWLHICRDRQGKPRLKSQLRIFLNRNAFCRQVIKDCATVIFGVWKKSQDKFPLSCVYWFPKENFS